MKIQLNEFRNSKQTFPSGKRSWFMLRLRFLDDDEFEWLYNQIDKKL